MKQTNAPPQDKPNATDSWRWFDDMAQWIDFQDLSDLAPVRPCEMQVFVNIALVTRFSKYEFTKEHQLIQDLDRKARLKTGYYDSDLCEWVCDEQDIHDEIVKLLRTMRINKSRERVKMLLHEIDAIYTRRELMGLD